MTNQSQNPFTAEDAKDAGESQSLYGDDVVSRVPHLPLKRIIDEARPPFPCFKVFLCVLCVLCGARLWGL